MNSKLLEEAIVDAEALREAALKNAEQAILEKYAPEVKSAISQLLEQDEPLADVPAAADVTAPLKDQPQMNVPLAATDGEELCPCPEQGEVLTFTAADLEDAIRKTVSSVVRSNGNPTPEAPETAGVPSMMTPEEEQDVMTPEPGAPVLEESIELDEELISSLLQEEEDSQVDINIEVDVEGDEDEDESSEDEEEKDSESLNNLMENQFRREISIIRKEVLAENNQLQTKNRSLLSDNIRVNNEKKLLNEQLTKLLDEKNKLIQENKQVKDTAMKLSQRLEESNLLNAKLFYKNKALGSVSLNERQKTKIVEAVSQACSPDEVKMIYETLCNAVGTFENKGPQSLDEAIEKKGGMFLPARQKQDAGNPQNNPLYSKWQKIAGIKKDKQS